MADCQIYHANDDSWATAAEVVVNDPVAGNKLNLRLWVEAQISSQIVIFAASTPAGQWASFTDTKLEILDNDLRSLHLNSESATEYISADERVAILINPSGRSWIASITEGLEPFSVSALALHPAAPAAGTNFSAGPRTRCRICKTTAKALGVAIVATAGAFALPAALLAAVSTFLGGVGAIAAAAFINSVVGDTADMVAQKLCMAVGLCP